MVTQVDAADGVAWSRRTFAMVYNGEEERRLVQYHFTDWPDRGVPISPQAFVKFVRTVMGTQQKAQRSVTASTVGDGTWMQNSWRTEL